ncbi:MAG: hypothetical protein ACREEM_32370, partial [Blastocatellia bacterium]
MSNHKWEMTAIFGKFHRERKVDNSFNPARRSRNQRGKNFEMYINRYADDADAADRRGSMLK